MRGPSENMVINPQSMAIMTSSSVNTRLSVPSSMPMTGNNEQCGMEKQLWPVVSKTGVPHGLNVQSHLNVHLI